jgi:UDP-3-O-[3-hydroxymyristoyl] glucosamine N-acyltransferase
VSEGSGQGVRLARARELSALVRALGGTLAPELEGRTVDRVVAPHSSALSTDLVWVGAPAFAGAARGLSAVVLCSADLAPRLSGVPTWIHPHADWVLAELLDEAADDGGAPAVIAPTARIEPGAVVLPGACVGEGSTVGPNAVIYGRVSLGARVHVGAGAVVGHPGFGWVTAPDGRVRRLPQLGGVIIEDDVELGALSTIDAGTLGPTRVCRGAKLDAQVHVGHNVEIGPGCMVAAQAGFAGSVVLGAGVMVGGQAGVKDHVRVGAGARIAAKSGVIGDVPPGVTVAGFPAVPRVRWLRAMARLLGR